MHCWRKKNPMAFTVEVPRLTWLAHDVHIAGLQTTMPGMFFWVGIYGWKITICWSQFTSFSYKLQEKPTKIVQVVFLLLNRWSCNFRVKLSLKLKHWLVSIPGLVTCWCLLTAHLKSISGCPFTQVHESIGDYISPCLATKNQASFNTSHTYKP